MGTLACYPREARVQFECQAGSSNPPAYRWCHPRQRADRLRMAESRKDGARCFLHSGDSRQDSSCFSDFGARPDVLPAEKLPWAGLQMSTLHHKPWKRSG